MPGGYAHHSGPRMDCTAEESSQQKLDETDPRNRTGKANPLGL